MKALYQDDTEQAQEFLFFFKILNFLDEKQTEPEVNSSPVCFWILCK
jgi:hypothetical protein